MPTINIQAQLSKKDLLEAVEQLSLLELEGFVQDVIALKAKHNSPSLSKDETELLPRVPPKSDNIKVEDTPKLVHETSSQKY